MENEDWRVHNLPEGQEPLSEKELKEKQEQEEAAQKEAEDIEKRHPDMDERLGADADTINQVFG